MNTYSSKEIAIGKRLLAAANEEGTIQAAEMLRLSLLLGLMHRPELHSTTSVGVAFKAITGKEFDSEIFA